MTPPLTPQEKHKVRALEKYQERQWHREHGVEVPPSPLAAVVLALFLAGLALFHPGGAALLTVLWLFSREKDR